MINPHETIEAFRIGTLDLDCTKIALRQRKNDGPRFEGPGYIRQIDGALMFKLYVDKRENADLSVIWQLPAAGLGTGLFHDDDFYDLTATSVEGTHWSAARIVAPRPSW